MVRVRPCTHAGVWSDTCAGVLMASSGKKLIQYYT